MPFSYSNSTTRAGGLLPALAFAASLLPAVGHAAEVVADLAPVGVLTATVPSGLSGLALPLIERELFSGLIASNDGTSITVADTAAALGTGLVSEGRYFLEIQSGPLEGERLDVNTAATLSTNNALVTLDLGTGSFSTLNTLPADALAGARCALRRHVTLSDLPAMFTPPLTGSNTPSLADGVQTYENDVFTRYYLRADGLVWRKSGSPDDQRHTVIPPDASILVELRSGEKNFLSTGHVRTNAFRIKLRAGGQSFSSGYPIPVSPVDIGAFADTSAPLSERWVGNNRPTQADSIMIYDPRTDFLDTYYLRGNGTSWYRAGASPGDQSASAFIAKDLVLVQRANADPFFVIPVPFNP